MPTTLLVTGGYPVLVDDSIVSAFTYDQSQTVDRGYGIRVYRSGAKWVGQVIYTTTRRRESPTSRILVADTAKGLAGLLLDYDPLQDVLGYPIGKQFDQKQRTLEEGLVTKWDSLVGSILVHLPGVASKA
jgi:hypothetical protein